MRYLCFLIFSTVFLNATQYFAKLEAYEKHIISSEVAAKVVFVNKDKEYTYIQKTTALVKLDSTQEEIELENLKNNLSLQKDLVKIKKQNYENKYEIKQLSLYDKNQEKLLFLEAKQKLEDIKRDIKIHQNNISKKEFYVKDKYVSEILIKKDEYVNIATPLYALYDFSKLKLEIFLRAKDIKDIKNKEIFVDGKKSQFQIEKISLLRDEIKVSTYKVILSKKNKSRDINLGKITKVEFK